MKYFFYLYFFFSSFTYANTVVYTDDFSTDTTSNYNVVNTLTVGGVASFNYDGAGERAHVLTGDDVALQFSTDVTVAVEGNFSIDFIPNVHYPIGGIVTIKLIENNNTYYKIEIQIIMVQMK